ncbi:MAG: 5-methylcytosine-specific restriction endonuclease system specificity protein McrC [Clostridia bacterium]|nr:5-methylcytosine-specific restriction endonuclease system specificity protein McrC [Clostridia bacterium]
MIPIRNIYYMLSYAFQTLNGQGYKDMATENFHNVADLCAAILCKGVSLQIKQGLGREYIEKTESLSTLRGRIDMSESIKTRSMLRQRLVCSYDDFSVNSPLNQIIKSTMMLLLHGDIAKSRKHELRRLLVYFGEVDAPDIHDINWHVQYNRHNEQYRMLISICYLVAKGLLQTNADGFTKLMDFLDEQRMSRLYEKFILEYYRKHFPSLHASASQIPWILDDEESTMLPVMQSDITLSKGNDVLIIDAKYYAHTTQTQYDVHTLHSNNLYQIFTYVKNKEAELINVPHKRVAGMLLYARTDEGIQPDHTYSMSGNKISVKTLDLNCEFGEIRDQLNEILASHYL